MRIDFPRLCGSYFINYFNYMNSSKIFQKDHNHQWLIFDYYVLKESILYKNMFNQGFECFIPKVKVIKNNKIREINLFPGYGFAYLDTSKISKLNYTIGIKTVLKQGKGYASISKTDISDLMLRSENTLTNPIIFKPNIGDTVMINKGVFKNNLAQVIGFKGKDRINLMLNFFSRETPIKFHPKNITQI